MKKLVTGILAHVDAGKTTLSEGILYLTGKIRKLGRVDHKDAYLDTYELERERGITIFSKQAVFKLGDMEVTLLDTPGHVDFSAEMERTLQVLDYAVLVINGADGVQSHTMTLWRLLAQYKIPVFLFVNKMDQEGTDRENLLRELKQRLNTNCVDFSGDRDRYKFLEDVSVCDEELMEKYLETEKVSQEDIIRLVRERKIFPCYFGSALKMTGVKEFLEGMEQYCRPPRYPEEFRAKVFKISRDDQGNRLTYMKITGGVLKVKEMLADTEKADQIRIYSGARFETVKEAPAGTVCAVTGLSHTYPGQGLGGEKESDMPVLEPVLNYSIILPKGCDEHEMLIKLKELEEEEPQLHIVWNEQLSEIHAMLMGEVQTEILKRLIWERFHVAVEFGPGKIVYKETIAEPVEGIGHFEPLRHYAEVHLLMEPGEPGSGMQFFTACSEDVLDRNWQRLILTHLEEREHPGVLTGSPITDMQITLLTGRAHVKHTEGGDFRQATYRAVRQGLKKARSILLEPYYEFRLEIPSENAGRAMTDIRKMQGTFQSPETEGDMMILKGSAPVSAMRDYQTQVISYSRGKGKLFCSLKGYAPCHDQEKIVSEIGYDSEKDLENPTGSVFCAHGAGFLVPWYEVEDYMHLEGMTEKEQTFRDPEPSVSNRPQKYNGMGSYEEDKELQAIFERTFGPVKRYENQPVMRNFSEDSKKNYNKYTSQKQEEKEYYLVDGYNIIYAWEELRELAQANLHAAQNKLMDILCNFQGFKKCILILVFDAYRLEGHAEEVINYHNIYVVYTKEAETADQYIEKTVHRIGHKNPVTVATSDGLEQIIIMGQGAQRISAREFREEIREVQDQEIKQWHAKRKSSKNFLVDNVSPEMADYINKVRLGDKKVK
ncbi:MAG: translation factor GTPase family protein [Blautia sp.]|nr:translation factor GTPase family protein [Blautia sp.]